MARRVILVVLAVLAITSCSSGSARPARPAALRPEGILAAPRGLLAAAEPQVNGMMWTLAGDRASKGLFELNLVDGRIAGSVSVSNAARSLAETLSGVIGLATGTSTTGALEMLNGGTATAIRTVPLGGPARDVVAGSSGASFYVLDGTPRSSSVTVVNAQNGAVESTVPVPLDTMSIVPDEAQDSIYALEPGGKVVQVAVAGGGVEAAFTVGTSGRSLAISPDGGTLYVLKHAGEAENVAAVNLATESVRQVLPAAEGSRQILVSPDGTRLYQVVGTPGYGNIQYIAG